jgi:hypothetical protein
MAIAHVIVYVQGTHRFLGGLSIDRFATGLSQALGSDYRPSAIVDRFNFLGRDISGRVIEKKDDTGAFQPSLRLVECDYYDIFEEIEEMTVIGRAIRTVRTVLPKLPLAANIFTFSESSEGRLQFAYLFLLLLATIIVPVILLGVVGFLVYDLADALAKLIAALQGGVPAPAGAVPPPPAPSPVGAVAQVAGYVAAFVSLLAVLKILWSSLVWKSARAFVAMFARDPLCMLEYLTRERGGHGITNRVVARVDKAIAFAHHHYPDAKIHVVAYSFGTIVTYDWLFPRSGDSGVSSPRQIHSFMALGFPFRMVMTFWRHYFEEQRDLSVPRLKRFINCTLKEDLVGAKVPDGNGLKRVLAATPGALEDHEDTLPPSLVSSHPFAQMLRRNNLVVWDGVTAHGQYFGFREDFSSPAFARCAEAIRTAT